MDRSVFYFLSRKPDVKQSNQLFTEFKSVFSVIFYHHIYCIFIHIDILYALWGCHRGWHHRWSILNLSTPVQILIKFF